MSFAAVQWALGVRGLAAGPRLVLLYLADHANSDGLAWPSRATLADECELPEQTIKRHLRHLRDTGLVTPTGETKHRVPVLHLALDQPPKGVTGEPLQSAKGVTGEPLEQPKGGHSCTPSSPKGVTGEPLQVPKGVTHDPLQAAKGVTGEPLPAQRGSLVNPDQGSLVNPKPVMGTTLPGISSVAEIPGCACASPPAREGDRPPAVGDEQQLAGDPLLPDGTIRRVVSVTKTGARHVYVLDPEVLDRQQVLERLAGFKAAASGGDLDLRTGLAALACRLVAAGHEVGLEFAKHGRQFRVVQNELGATPDEMVLFVTSLRDDAWPLKTGNIATCLKAEHWRTNWARWRRKVAPEQEVATWAEKLAI